MIREIFYWIIAIWSLFSVITGGAIFLGMAARHSDCKNPNCVKFYAASFWGLGFIFAAILLMSKV